MNILINIAIIIISSICYTNFELYKYLSMFMIYNLIIIFIFNYIWYKIKSYCNHSRHNNILDKVAKKKDINTNTTINIKDKIIKELKNEIDILEEYINMTNNNKLYYTEFGKKLHKSIGCISSNINIYNFIVVDNEMLIILERADRMCNNCDFDEDINNDKITLYYAKTGKKLYTTLTSIEKTTSKDRILEITISKMQYSILLHKMPDLFIE
jgi:hypothetical protein